jgi:hypothetical protein
VSLITKTKLGLSPVLRASYLSEALFIIADIILESDCARIMPAMMNNASDRSEVSSIIEETRS